MSDNERMRISGPSVPLASRVARVVMLVAASGCRAPQPPVPERTGTTPAAPVPEAIAQSPEQATPNGRRDPWEEARQRGIDFRGLGQEPGWYLEIDDGRSMRLVYDYMEREATTPAPPPVIAHGRTTYGASTGSHSLTVVIEDQPCQDVMSGEPFPSTVTVMIDDRELRGCGRDLR